MVQPGVIGWGIKDVAVNWRITIHYHDTSLLTAVTLPTACRRGAGGGPQRQDRTSADAGLASCRPGARIAWPPPPGNLGYGCSGHTSVDGHLDFPHAAASLVYSPAPLHSVVQWLKKFRKMQLHQAATRAFGYTVHDGSIHTDGRRRSDYVMAFHLADRLPFQYSRPCDTWHHVIRLPLNNRFPQNDYLFCLKNGFNTTSCEAWLS